MRKKGSVTLFFSLFLAVLLVVIQVIFRSVQIAGGKVQAETGVEEGLYSVFAGYDRELLKRYHVFFLDGGYGTGVLQPGRMYEQVEDKFLKSCSPGKIITDVRGENLWNCSKNTGAVTGITLAADQDGRAFKIQAIDYMKDTLGIQGIQLLLQQVQQQKTILDRQETDSTAEPVEQAQDEYQQAQGQVQEKKEEDSEFVNPLKVIALLKDKGILSLVLPLEAELSDAGFGEMEKMSSRSCTQGMGILYYGQNPDNLTDNMIFREYMLKHLNYYGREDIKGKLPDGALQYQLEYALAGKDSDQENLKSVVGKLLGLREAANMVYLLKNSVRQAQIHETALIICAATGLVALEEAVSLLLQAAWAFGESLLDVRQLLMGGKVPLVKTEQSWMLSLSNLGKLPEILQEGQTDQDSGLDYAGYLRLLLAAGSSKEQVLRTMDVAEQEMRCIAGKENFRMDLCVSYLQVEMKFSCCGKNFTIQREYGYEM